MKQKSGNQKYSHLSFAQYLKTGGQVRDTRFETNVSNEISKIMLPPPTHRLGLSSECNIDQADFTDWMSFIPCNII